MSTPELGSNSFSNFGVGNSPPITRQLVEGQDKVRLNDSDAVSELDLFCYVYCSAQDNRIVKESRGVVFNKDTVVMKSYPYTDEFDATDVGAITTTIGDKFDKCSFYESFEGALIRVFYFGAKWYVSTHRKLDANRSKWSSRKSFGEVFRDGIEQEYFENKVFAAKVGAVEQPQDVYDKFLGSLNQDYQYMFVVLNTLDNRIVCNVPARSTVYHVGTFAEKGAKYSMTVDCGIPYPAKIEFTSIKEVLDYVQDTGARNHQGVVVMCESAPWGLFKIMNTEYNKLFSVRGNEPSINFRYLQIRMNRDMTSLLYMLYPRSVEKFEEYENILWDIAKEIYESYKSRYIKKTFITIPKEEFIIMDKCHKWHMLNRQENKVSLEVVINNLNLQTPTHLNKLIKAFVEKHKKVVGAAVVPVDTA